MKNNTLTTTEALETIKDAVTDSQKNDSELMAGDVEAIEDALTQIADKKPNEAATAEELKEDVLVLHMYYTFHFK